MALIDLGKQYFAIIDDEDFERLNKYNWSTTNRGRYAVRNVHDHSSKSGFKTKYMTYEVLNIEKTPGIVIDHINRNGLDNRKENLRVTTQRANTVNCMRNEKGSVGIHAGSWRVRSTYLHKRKLLGSYKDKAIAEKVALWATNLREMGDWDKVTYENAKQYAASLTKENQHG